MIWDDKTHCELSLHDADPFAADYHDPPGEGHSVAQGISLGNSVLAPLDEPFSYRQSPVPAYLPQPTGEHQHDECITSPPEAAHFSISYKPAKCNCGALFTRKCSLQRHVTKFNKNNNARFPCPECPKYQGKQAFIRKDHLVQHLRVFHRHGKAELSPYTGREADEWFYPFCHFTDCDFYRDHDFSTLSLYMMKENRPFDRRPDYIVHMRKDHDWSPISCDFPGCDKTRGKGFFTLWAFHKHRRTKHSQQDLSDNAAKKYGIKCQLCQERHLPVELWSHLRWECGVDIECRKCHVRMKQSVLGDHLRSECEAIIECFICKQNMQQKDMNRHFYEAHQERKIGSIWE
ncbi:hypothetical protein F5Y18DRAFT_393520 [Xylariaceae sp. FL1019]|nr:hypothetical protein F5Y18DRAFT_393520 [Xylariaceae sp. FL1019]